LAEIYRGHLSFETAEARLNRVYYRFVPLQSAAQQFGYGLSRQVIFGGPQPAASDYDRHAIQRVAKSLAE
jgi:hypothetical protein